MAYDIPRGSVIGSMPELNVLCAIADHSEQSGQPLTKKLIVEVTPAVTGRNIEPGSPPTSYLGSTPLLGLGEPQQITQWR